MSLVAVGLMFSFIVTPAFGVFNVLYEKIGICDPTPISRRSASALYTLIVIFGWLYWHPADPLPRGGAQIPAELYQAARLDGASAVQQLVG